MASNAQKRKFDEISGQSPTEASSSTHPEAQQQTGPSTTSNQSLPFTTLSYGKTHAEYLAHSRPGIRYLPHHVTGVRQLINHDNYVRFGSIQYVEHFARLSEQHSLREYRKGPWDFLLIIIEPGEEQKVLKLHTSILRHNKTMAHTIGNAMRMSQSRISARWEVKSLWVTVKSIEFGIAMIMGQDPTTWFRERNVEQDVPKSIATSVRVSLQRMILALQFTAAVSILQLPKSYEDLGLYIIQKELDWWNFELVLSFLCRGHECIWETSPLESGFGTTFEPMTTIWKTFLGYANGVPSAHSAARLFCICAVWFRDNLPRDLSKLLQPAFVSAALGGRRHENVGGCFRSPTEEFKKYRHPLATILIMSSISPEFVPHPDPQEIAIPLILPVILVSIPYGILKMFLYSTNISIPQKYAFAHILCGWRYRRQHNTSEEFTKRTELHIFWERSDWVHYARRDPPIHSWSIRNRYVEVPYLIKMSDGKGGTVDIFDFKRYWYNWQVFTADEWQEIEREYIVKPNENEDVHKQRQEATKLLVDDLMGVKRQVASSGASEPNTDSSAT